MSNPPSHGLATPDLRQRLPTTNHGPAVPTRVYQSDRASRTACRTATHPADHTASQPPDQRRQEIRDAPLDNALSISVSRATCGSPPALAASKPQPRAKARRFAASRCSSKRLGRVAGPVRA
jgi:hypothetical protein